MSGELRKQWVGADQSVMKKIPDIVMIGNLKRS